MYIIITPGQWRQNNFLNMDEFYLRGKFLPFTNMVSFSMERKLA